MSETVAWYFLCCWYKPCLFKLPINLEHSPERTVSELCLISWFLFKYFWLLICAGEDLSTECLLLFEEWGSFCDLNQGIIFMRVSIFFHSLWDSPTSKLSRLLCHVINFECILLFFHYKWADIHLFRRIVLIQLSQRKLSLPKKLRNFRLSNSNLQSR